MPKKLKTPRRRRADRLIRSKPAYFLSIVACGALSFWVTTLRAPQPSAPLAFIGAGATPFVLSISGRSAAVGPHASTLTEAFQQLESAPAAERAQLAEAYRNTELIGQVELLYLRTQESGEADLVLAPVDAVNGGVLLTTQLSSYPWLANSPYGTRMLLKGRVDHVGGSESSLVYLSQAQLRLVQ